MKRTVYYQNLKVGGYLYVNEHSVVFTEQKTVPAKGKYDNSLTSWNQNSDKVDIVYLDVRRRRRRTLSIDVFFFNWIYHLHCVNTIMTVRLARQRRVTPPQTSKIKINSKQIRISTLIDSSMKNKLAEFGVYWNKYIYLQTDKLLYYICGTGQDYYIKT